MLVPKSILDDPKQILTKRENHDLDEILELSYNNLVEKILDQVLSEYNNFYGMKLEKDDIKIHRFTDRESFDIAVWAKTENWVRANTKWKDIYLFEFDSLEKATWWYHKKDVWNYIRCVRHEIAHTFYWCFLEGKYLRINRLNEGMSIYLSWQLSEREPLKKFEAFLNYWQWVWKGVYQEAGFFVAFLIEKFGKEKIFELIKSLHYLNTEEDFLVKFKEVFWFDLEYTAINTIYNKKNPSTQEESGF